MSKLQREVDEIMARPQPAVRVKEGRPLEAVAIRPGISLYVGRRSYVDTTLNTQTHRHLRLWDVGSHCLVESVDDSGKVEDSVELLWHAVWYRKAKT